MANVRVDQLPGAGSLTGAELIPIEQSGVLSNVSVSTLLFGSGGATGGGTNQVFYNNDQAVTVNYSIPVGKNSMSTGPITIAAGVTVTVPSGSRWAVI